MRQSEIIDAIDYKINRGRAPSRVIPKSIIEEVYNTFRDTTVVTLKKKGSIVIRDIGTFEVVTTPSKTGTHPKTGRKIVIPERKRIRFKMHKKLKQAINPRKKQYKEAV